MCMKLGSATSVNIWKDGVKYDEITINERQKNDSEYSVIFYSVRRGHLNQYAISVLSH